MKFAVLIPIGPGVKELERVDDLFNALFHYESPSETAIVIVNDGNSAADLLSIANKHSAVSAEVLENPRNGKGTGWSDGMAVGVLAALGHIARKTHGARFVLKLDTDSLVINRFADKIVRYFDEHPEVGLIGTYLHEPDGRRSNTIEVWGRAVQKLQRTVTLWRTPTGWHPQIALYGRARCARKIVNRAVAYGYIFAESCIGGGYALSRGALEKMMTNGCLDDPFLFLNRSITEDVVVGLLASSTGVKLADFNSPGQAFGVIWEGLCDPPPELLRQGYSIIHSIKDFGICREDETRQFFADARRARSTVETRHLPRSDFEG